MPDLTSPGPTSVGFKDRIYLQADRCSGKACENKIHIGLKDIIPHHYTGFHGLILEVCRRNPLSNQQCLYKSDGNALPLMYDVAGEFRT